MENRDRMDVAFYVMASARIINIFCRFYDY